MTLHWRSAVVVKLIQVGLGVVAAYWIFRPPAAGVSIAIIGFVAVIMTVRADHFTRNEKIVWVIVAFLLLYVEIRAIGHDRTKHDQEQANARTEQISNFQTIAGGITKAVRQSEQHFETTMASMAAIIKSSTATQRNTESRAVIKFDQMTVYAPSLPFKAGSSTEFNIWYQNGGNEPATNIVNDAKLYLGKLDDRDFEKHIAREFDKWWVREPRHRTIPVFPIQQRDFFSIDTPVFTDADLRDLPTGNKTIYAVTRVVYQDHTGTWASDACFAFQNPMHDFAVGHECLAHNNPRYRWNAPMKH